MKKTIKIICGVFILCTIIENINFIFAQFEDAEENPVNEIEYLNNEHKSDSNPGGEIPVQVSESDNNQASSVDNNKEDSNSEEITNQIEEDLNITPSPKLRGAPMMAASQSTQTINTSNYGIIRIKDPEHPGQGITIHDRNLGATATGYGATDDINTYGYYFQWGNNYGFSSNPSESIIGGNTQVDAASYGPNNPYSSDTFIKGKSDWSSVHNDNLRGGEGDNIENERGLTSDNPIFWRRGPCPLGYHIPSIGEFKKLIYLWENEYNEGFSSNKGVFTFSQKFQFPFANGLDYNMKLKNGIYLWSSSPVNSYDAFRLYGDTNNIYTNANNYRAYAFPIRCFYDSYRLPVKILYKINGGYRTDNTSNEDKVITYTKDDDNSDFSGDILLGTVKRKNNCGENEDKKCMFGGWYTLTGDEMWTGNIAEDITLVAKWLEFEDLDVSYSGVNFTIMDRNLGEENSGVEKNAYGYYLTGGEDDITCPEGYHIPSTGEWLGIKKLLGSVFNGNIVKDLLGLPFAGKIVNDEIVGTGTYGYYLTKNGDEIMYAKISDSDIEIQNLGDGEKVSARCFKDYNTGTIKFHTNGGDNISDIITVNRREAGQSLNDAERDNSIFSGWYTTPDFKEGSKLEKNINYRNEEEINLYAKWECEEGYQEGNDSCDAIYFDITWIDGDGNNLRTDSVKWGEIPVYDGAIPTKSSTTDYKYTFNNNWLPAVTAAFEDTGYMAQFNAEYIKKSGGNSGGGGRRNSSKDINVASGTNARPAELAENLTGDTQDSSVDILVPERQISPNPSLSRWEENYFFPIDKWDTALAERIGQGDYPQEFIDAYNFAYKYGITTKPSIQNAKMYSPLTRIQMAKMLSIYAINVLGKEPDISKGTIKFDDVSNKLNKDYNNAVTLVYQLGVMGQNIKSNKFRPHDEVTRAEFVTTLSRMLYGTKDGTGKTNYYEPHITMLYNKGLIYKTDPTIREKRGYLMIILKRYPM